MKSIRSMFVIGVLLSAMSALAEPAPYITDPMYCAGKIIGNSRHVHSDYSQILVKYSTFFSVRRDRSKALSLEVSNAYFGPTEKIDVTKASYGEVWYMAPLAIDGNLVFRTSLSGREDDLNLKVVGSRSTRNGRVDQLVGTWMLPNTPAGSYGYALKCEARVVSTPTRIIDLTRKAR